MTPARLAEIRAYIRRLDLDQLPPWTVEQAIIADLWEAVEAGRAWADEWRASNAKDSFAWIYMDEAADCIDAALGSGPYRTQADVS